MDISNLKKDFASPVNTYRFAPFWFLNHDLKDDELVWQIHEMHENGVGGFVLHARLGLITPYLSDEWMDRMETCIKEADKLRMKAILYDENNWPSGPVDGELTERFPEYRMSGCRVSQEWTVNAGRRLKEKIDPLDELIAVVAVPVGRKGVMEGLPESAVSLMSYVSDGMLDWKAPEGRWRVMVFARKFLVPYGFFGAYLDTLSKDAVAKFIEMTHERYAERFAEYFGGTVDGMFTDEPSMNYHPLDTVPWTPTLPSEFGWRHDYDIIGVLPAVFGDAGPISAQLRCDFYDTVTELYSEAYFKQIYDWCDSRRLKSIGHVNAEGEFYADVRHQGDFFRGARYMHYGGCDFLETHTWPACGDPHAGNNLLGPKLASSAAHIYGKPRVMSEAFGVADGWKINLRTLKHLADWQVALGVNMFEPHAFYYSIQGFRKWECPPGEFYQSSFWPYYRTFADYVARLCSVFTGAHHVADVAVVLPVRAMWSAFNPYGTPEADRTFNTFEKVTTALLKAGFDFDILPEESLIHDVNPTDLEHMQSLERYQALIVPGCSTNLEETAHFLNTAIMDGNAIIVCDDLPKTFVTEGAGVWPEGSMTPDILAEQFRLEYDWKKTGLERRHAAADADALSVLIPDVAPKSVDEVTEALSKVLTEIIYPDVTVRDIGSKKPYIPDIIHCHYRHGDNDFLFFSNTSLTESYLTRIRVNVLGVPSVWDAMTGEVVPLREFAFQGDELEFRLDFEPTQSILISVTTEDVSDVPLKPDEKQPEEKVTTLGDEWEFTALTPNALPIKDWQFEMSTSTAGWSYGIHEYTAKFECKTELKTARLLIDGLLMEKLWRRSTPLWVEITLNDRVVQNFEQGSYLDHLIKEADVAELIVKDENVLKIRTKTQLSTAGNLSDPAYIIGDFAVEDSALVREPKKLTTGSWTDQGYPFLSGTMSYQQKVKLKAPKGKVLLRMEKPEDMAEVIINGNRAGILPWEPWEVDITPFIKSGENEIEIRVTNSMLNLLNMEPKASGLVGRVDIVEIV